MSTETVKRDVRIAYIGGGSRGWAWGLMADLAMEKSLGGTVRLYDIDKAAAEQNALIGNRLSAREEAVGKWAYEVADSLQEALEGSHFVVISILPGTFDEMDSDVHAPEKYGIYQSVGDTVGPGGMIRALRTIPMFEEIARAIRAFAPDAWVINYTNPMSVCVRTLYEVFPQIKAIGCCHEVFGTQKLLALALKEICGIDGVDRQEIRTNVLGINHFTWIDRASFYDRDLFPVYEEFVERYAAEGYLGEKADKNWMNDHFASAEMVKMDLFRRYGVIAAAGDRHLAEFVPGWYLKDPETAAAWKFSLTPVSWRREDLQRRLEKSRRLAAGEEEVALEKTGEEGVLLIRALLGLGDMVTNVNIPNQGQIGNLPMGAVVETNAWFGRDQVRPVYAGNLPDDIWHLVIRHVTNQEGVVKACMKKDRKMLFNIFMNDPLVRISPKEGKELFDTMIKNTEKYCVL